jgi:predicted enzyme related to lactoylglutathione lyase
MTMGTLQGSWIWYELMTPDPQGAREFYQAVGGWTISPGHGDQDDYSLIARADGVLTGSAAWHWTERKVVKSCRPTSACAARCIAQMP